MEARGRKRRPCLKWEKQNKEEEESISTELISNFHNRVEIMEEELSPRSDFINRRRPTQGPR